MRTNKSTLLLTVALQLLLLLLSPPPPPPPTLCKSFKFKYGGGGHLALKEESRGTYRVLVRKLEGRRPLERPRRRWEDNIKMDLREVGWGDMDWIDFAQNRNRWRHLLNAVMNLRVP
jgi:hypothetical protein